VPGPGQHGNQSAEDGRAGSPGERRGGPAKDTAGSLLFRVALLAVLRAADTASGRPDRGEHQIPSYSDVETMIATSPGDGND
jgi:hypothetical protein